MKRIARSMYRLIYFVPLAVLFTLMIIAANLAGPKTQGPPTFVLWSCGLFFGWLFLGRRIALMLLPLLISTLKCPGCSEEISAIGKWNCGCGFHDYKERHVLAGACPKCGNRTGHLNCPRCDSTLLLW
jgi:hypothetical protein